jgi:hypothetical protein
LKKEIDSSDENVPWVLRAWKANCAEVEAVGVRDIKTDGVA